MMLFQINILTYLVLTFSYFPEVFPEVHVSFEKYDFLKFLKSFVCEAGKITKAHIKLFIDWHILHAAPRLQAILCLFQIWD